MIYRMIYTCPWHAPFTDVTGILRLEAQTKLFFIRMARRIIGWCYQVSLTRPPSSILSLGLPTRDFDIYSCIHISIVMSTTIETLPLPYRQGFMTFPISTSRTGLAGRCPSANYPHLTPIHLSFSFKHSSELSPAKIMNGPC